MALDVSKYQERGVVVHPLKKTEQKERASVDDEASEEDAVNTPKREVLANEGPKDEEAKVDDAKDGAELGGGGALLGRLQGVEGGLQGGAEADARLREVVVNSEAVTMA